ncbi:MAG: D-hexose-6-phosphate mutarotase, partial [Gammaproteobacteria bacterium]|nr:D-hexose-6-phosphate mutarotase [Gammaproteobacteria bacterium]
PICWPWFGAHESDASLPGHGFARTVPWQLVETKLLNDDVVQLVFSIVNNDATRAMWPHATELNYVVTMGQSLELDLVTHNTGSTAVTIGDALHTYFNVSDVRHVAVQGLDGCEYLDKVDGFKSKRQTGAVTINEEVDRVYLDTSADCLIEDPGFKRRIVIAKRGSHSTVVWNPWLETATKMGDLGKDGYLHMLCVESANAVTDVVKLDPGEEHHLWVSYSVESMD